ncbi:MAG: hypothetical protein ACREXW_15290 [Gammaproteobacteria bacterium]
MAQGQDLSKVTSTNSAATGPIADHQWEARAGVVTPRISICVAKAERARQFATRVFLSRLATEFVERFDKQKG